MRCTRNKSLDYRSIEINDFLFFLFVRRVFGRAGAITHFLILKDQAIIFIVDNLWSCCPCPCPLLFLDCSPLGIALIRVKYLHVLPVILNRHYVARLIGHPHRHTYGHTVLLIFTLLGLHVDAFIMIFVRLQCCE